MSHVSSVSAYALPQWFQTYGLRVPSGNLPRVGMDKVGKHERTYLFVLLLAVGR